MTFLKKIVKSSIVFFKNLKLRHKIALLTSLLILLSTTMTLMFIYMQFRSVIEEKSHNETHQLVVQIANFYDEKLTKIVNLTQGIFENEDFRRSLQKVMWDEQYNYAVESSTIQMVFQPIRLKDKLIDSFFLYTPKGVFYENAFKRRSNIDFIKTNLYKSYKEDPYNIWRASYPDEIFINDSQVIPLLMNINFDGNFYDDEVLVVNLRETEFRNNLSSIGGLNKASVYIINDSGEIVSSSEYKDYKPLFDTNNFKRKIKENNNGYFKSGYDGSGLYVNCSEIKINGWDVVFIQPESELLKDVSRLQVFVILIGIFSLTIAVMLSFIIASTITKPIYKLNNTMLSIQNGHLDSRFKSKYMDEIGQLGMNFNNTLDEIQSLIKAIEMEREKTKEEHRQKVKADMKALQAQINPHFLYNTLDSIYWKSKLGENELVSQMIVSLSKLLRIGLSKGRDKVTVENEIEHVRNYLYIQSNVYSNKFDYSIEVEGDVSRYIMIKLILQPLVENSIQHGFNGIKYRGDILIDVKVMEDCIRLRVIDNGKGFDIDSVGSSICAYENDKGTDTKGYALGNVYQRLVLEYGEEYAIKFESKPYERTTVEIKIPKEEI